MGNDFVMTWSRMITVSDDVTHDVSAELPPMFFTSYCGFTRLEWLVRIYLISVETPVHLLNDLSYAVSAWLNWARLSVWPIC